MNRGSPFVIASFALAWFALAALAPAVLAQQPTGSQWEGRVDVIAARTPSLQAGVALNIPAGLYVRLGAGLAAGLAHQGGIVHGAARADLMARFLMDPYRENKRALYGIAGLSVMGDGFEQWRPRVVVGVGAEGRVRRGRVMAAELALGGGLRGAIVIRGARRTGR